MLMSKRIVMGKRGDTGVIPQQLCEHQVYYSCRNNIGVRMNESAYVIVAAQKGV